MDLTELIALSRRYGSDPELVLAGGGNTSVKDSDTLFVKSSGARLSDINEAGFAAMGRHKLEQMLDRAYPSGDREREAAALSDLMEARLKPEQGQRPSVETLLHHLFPQRYVLHIHPALFNGLACSQNGEVAARTLFGSRVLWIPESRPGLVLARLCRERMAAYREREGRDADLMLLQNHGLFLAADSPRAIDALFEEAAGTLRAAVGENPDLRPLPPSPRARALKETLEALTGGSALFVSAGDVQAFLKDESSMLPLLKPFTPDHIVYAGAWPLVLREGEGPEDAFRAARGAPPWKIVLAQGTGAFALGRDGREAELAAELFLDAVKIAVYSRSFGGPRHLSDDLTAFILSWEAESYRKNLEARRTAP